MDEMDGEVSQADFWSGRLRNTTYVDLRDYLAERDIGSSTFLKGDSKALSTPARVFF